jgi:subtilase family serine protease
MPEPYRKPALNHGLVVAEAHLRRLVVSMVVSGLGSDREGRRRMGAVRHSRIPKRIAALAVGSIMGLPAVGVAASAPALGASGPGPAAKSVGSKIVGSKIVGTTPRAVSADAVVATRPHDATAVLTLNLGLAVRNSADLDARIRAASTPGDPGYGHYLTNAEYRARYAPTDAQVAAVRTWLTSQGARVTSVSPDNLIVGVRATTATAERAFRVSLHDYRQGNRTLYANDVAPSVPADSSVRWVTGLDDFATLHHFADTAVGPAFRAGGYFPSDFRKAYGVSSVPLSPSGVTNDETIGLTLWGAPLLQSDLTHFAGDTSTPALVINQAGANGINFIPCSTASCNPAGSQDGDTGSWDETALDVESAHGIAPGAHLKYWLGTTSVQGGQLLPDVAAVEQAVNAAANDSSLKVVSNSWGFGADVSDPTMDTSLQHAAAVGTTFYFSTGDSAAISYPATSPYVVAVGGTSLNLDGSANYVGESAWSGSGSGCSGLFARPVWQVGVGNAATCGGRAEPDVAADADPATGAYVFVGASASQIGGTSLAAPLWAGMTAVWNEANLQAAKPGAAAPHPCSTRWPTTPRSTRSTTS